MGWLGKTLGLEMNWQKTNGYWGQHEEWAIDNHRSRQEVAVVEEFVYLGSVIHSTQSSPGISCRIAITCAPRQKQNNHSESQESPSTPNWSWNHHVQNDNVRRTTGRTHFSAIVHSKHGVSPCLAALPECQMKQMHEPRRSQQLPLDYRGRLPGNPSTTWMKTWNPITSPWMKQLT